MNLGHHFPNNQVVYRKSLLPPKQQLKPESNNKVQPLCPCIILSWETSNGVHDDSWTALPQDTVTWSTSKLRRSTMISTLHYFWQQHMRPIYSKTGKSEKSNKNRCKNVTIWRTSTVHSKLGQGSALLVMISSALFIHVCALTFSQTQWPYVVDHNEIAKTKLTARISPLKFVRIWRWTPNVAIRKKKLLALTCFVSYTIYSLYAKVAWRCNWSFIHFPTGTFTPSFL